MLLKNVKKKCNPRCLWITYSLEKYGIPLHFWAYFNLKDWIYMRNLLNFDGHPKSQHHKR